MRCSVREAIDLTLPLLLVAVLVTVSPAGIVRVPADAPTIQAGIDAAAFGDTVLIAAGLYCEYDIILRSGVSVVGDASGPGCVTIDAQGLGRVLVLDGIGGGITIRDLTLTGGDAGEQNGGAMFCGGSFPLVESCTFVGNSGVRGGAVVSRNGAAADFVDCTFGFNERSAIYVYGGSVRLEDCVMHDNRGIDGGALQVKNGELYVTGCTLERNESLYGGAVYYEGATGAINDCLFLDNVAERWGGALCLFMSSPPLEDCSFVSNSCDGRGGAVFFDGYGGTSSSFTRCLFEGNSSGGDAGAVLGLLTFDAAFLECAFVANSSADNDGTVLIGGGDATGVGEVRFEDCVFEGNSTRLDCAALHLAKYETSILRCTFSGNTAGRDAGAVECSGYAVARLTNCTFHNNTAEGHGAAILAGNYADVHVEKSILAFCTGTNTAHCVYPATLIAECCDVFGNPTGTDWEGCLLWQYGDAGNLHVDPQFCLDLNPEIPLSLRATSPCAAAECGEGVPLGAYGVGCEVTPVEHVSWGLLKARYR